MVRESLRAQTGQKESSNEKLIHGALATSLRACTNLPKERPAFVSQRTGRQAPGAVFERGARRGEEQRLVDAAERAREGARRLWEAVILSVGLWRPHDARKVSPLGAVFALDDGRCVVGRAAADAVVRLC